MHFPSLAIFVVTLFLCAHGSYPYVPSDIHCPAGSHNGFIHNSYTYLAPLHRFTDITGSFFNLTWYDGTVINATTGVDNVPGATRSGYFGDAVIHETLTAFTAHPDKLEYTYLGKPAAGDGVDYEGYVETLRFMSICGGTATYIDAIAYVCSRHRITGYSVWYQARVNTYLVLAADLGAPTFTGDCPEET